MSDFCRVAWTEGMFLRPQHFQQQERHVSAQHRALVSQLLPFAWGVSSYETDTAALKCGQFGLREYSGILPDGVSVNAPAREALPQALAIPPSTRNKLIYIAVPTEHANNLNLSAVEDGQVTRFQYADHEVIDVSVGCDAAETLQLARLVMSLKLEGDEMAGYTFMPIAKVLEVTEEGGVALDPKYVPPCLNVQRIPRLAALIKELAGMLAQRGDALAGRLSQGQGTASSIADFLMLQLINRQQPLIEQLACHEGTHPYALVQQLYGLVGELSTFCSDSKRPQPMPSYRHDELTSLFGSLDVLLNQSLSTVLEQTAINLPMEVTKFGIRVSSVPDKGLFTSATFVLAVKADIPPEELRSNLPAQLKVGPVEHIRDLVNNQLPGILAAVLPVAPRQIPYHAGYHYFELDKSNDYWKRLNASGGIAVHLSGNYPGLEMDLWAINQ
ncbi:MULTISPECIES: type VI secretion system baseplate subunit TssK [Corallincola]|uniref:Type VI secretion system baseplate subunit TssK n=2 Tax=Corallincola TaxID=1775176 RepID=A0A368NRK2_9GAMM|nr:MULTISPECIES: type VI secretion system baseplate subunit TssK [Corallincola]RCU52740.1 type VI secretion system baseplate subunit TssK [Corallincola holothuriorum]TAA48078.1 type VI secretion system baseplate subunit TssK [Corallincola spongiicola]